MGANSVSSYFGGNNPNIPPPLMGGGTGEGDHLAVWSRLVITPTFATKIGESAISGPRTDKVRCESAYLFGGLPSPIKGAGNPP